MCSGGHVYHISNSALEGQFQCMGRTWSFAYNGFNQTELIDDLPDYDFSWWQIPPYWNDIYMAIRWELCPKPFTRCLLLRLKTDLFCWLVKCVHRELCSNDGCSKDKGQSEIIGWGSWLRDRQRKLSMPPVFLLSMLVLYHHREAKKCGQKSSCVHW